MFSRDNVACTCHVPLNTNRQQLVSDQFFFQVSNKRDKLSRDGFFPYE